MSCNLLLHLKVNVELKINKALTCLLNCYIYFVLLNNLTPMKCVFEANILCVNIKASFVKVFRMRTPAEAVELVSVLLEYTPSLRVSPLQACAHAFFDELRDPLHRLPNGRSLPPLFNFTQLGN